MRKVRNDEGKAAPRGAQSSWASRAPCIPSPDTGLEGIFEDWKCLGEIAVDALVAMLNRGERGAPDRPQRLHVEGPWIAGRTLRAQGAA